MTKTTTKMIALLARAGSVGLASAGAFDDAVQLFAEGAKALPKGYNPLKASDMAKLARNYQAGYIAKSLLRVPAFAKKWGNYGPDQLIAEGEAILAKPARKEGEITAKMRTQVEQDACRAASTSCSKARKRAFELAGIVSPRAGAGGRKPRPSSNKSESDKLANDAPAFTGAVPKLETPEAANTFFANAIAALLAGADVNANSVDKRWSDFIADTYARAVKAKLIPSKE